MSNKITAKQIADEYLRTLDPDNREEFYRKQRRKFDKELRRIGKVRSNFRNKKQKRYLLRLAALQRSINDNR